MLHELCYEVHLVLQPEYLPKQFLMQEKCKKCIQGFEALSFPKFLGVIDKLFKSCEVY